MPPTQQHQQPWNNILKHFFVWWVVLIVLAVALAGFFVLRGPWQEWRSLARSQRLEDELIAARASFDAVQREANAWQALSSQGSNQLDLMLPTTPDVPNLLAQLEAVARAAGFTVDAVATTDAAPNARVRTSAGVRTVSVTLSISGGSYPKLKDFLASIHRSWRITQVNSFGVGGDGSYRLELASFYYPR